MGAVYNGQAGPADITSAGGLSPYGTMGQGGNAWEWMETEYDLVKDSSGSSRGLRGGSWNIDESSLRASLRYDGVPAFGLNSVGFRVASVPEPTSLVLTMLASGVMLLRRRR